MRRIGSGKLITVYYHIVSDEDVPHIKNLYKYKRPRQFSDDLEFLLKYYLPAGLSEVIHRGKDEDALPPNSFLLTFDDGLREIHDVIAPILLSKGIHATFFISSAFLDNQEMCYEHKASLLVEKLRKGISVEAEREIKKILVNTGRSDSQLSEGLLKIDYRNKEALDRVADVLLVNFKEYLVEKQPYLTSSQVKNLIEQGFTIGAHSIDHPYYSDLSLAEQLEQTIESVRTIRKKFNLHYGAFAFPHTDAGVSPEYFAKVREFNGIDITFGTGGMIDRGIESHKPRVNLEDPSQSAHELLAWQYARSLSKKWAGKK